MTLRDLIQEMDVAAVRGDPQVPVTGLALDSRSVRRGELFFALAGVKQDGGAFVESAFAAGACGAVVARGTSAAHAPVIEVEEPRLALAQAACSFHGHPSRALTVAAVTGTNGKTTVTWMLESIFRAAGLRSGRIGTTGYRIGDETRAAPFTTPEAPALQALLREMADVGVQAVALEASSHALAQRRTYGLECDVVAFTNLTQDHLDYHRTMEAYLDAKLMLFDGRNGARAKRGVAVVNGGDPSARRVIEAARRGGLEVLTVGLDVEGTAPATGLDLSVGGIEPTPDGLILEARVDLPERLGRARAGRHPARASGGTRFRLPLLGRYNAVNAIVAWGAAIALDIEESAIRSGLEKVPAVPGRLERVEAGQPFEVLVDYAHTPDALERALSAVREHFSGRVLLVFGCGGDRDRGKRPLMGRRAASLADRAWVTNDNPRGEDPRAIADEIVAGAPDAGLEIVLDRREAIAAALAAARPGDAVLIAGKGHETTQTVGDRVLPFDDREVTRALVSPAAGSEDVMTLALRPTLTLTQLAQFSGGDLAVREVPASPGEREALLRSGVDGASIDTRTLVPGQLFVPLPGGNTDGHRFLEQAFARGAGAALCARDHYATFERREPGPLIVVDDVTLALQRIARRYRAGWPGVLYGVTGSVGKTTTKDLVAAVLGTLGPTLRTEGNLNNHWGVPLTLLGLEAGHFAAVVEMGSNHPGEIQALATLARPNRAVITGAGSAHLEHFGSLEAIAREKASLGHALMPGDTLFVSADSEALLAALKGARARRVTYGFARGADLRPKKLESRGGEGTRIEVEGFPPFTLPVAGRHQVANALGALAVAREAGADPAAATRAIEAWRPAKGRMEVRHARGAVLLVDCYNANPESTAGALETLAGWPGAGRRIALLGDMLELGETAPALHRETGAKVRAAELWVVGAHAEDYAAGGRQARVPVRVFADVAAVARALREALAPGVVVLLKGSRGARLERVLEGLEAEGR